MKNYLFILLFLESLFGGIINIISSNNEAYIIANHQAHLEYGLSYPVTYMFDIPEDAQDFNAYRKYSHTGDWADYCNEKFIQACQNFRNFNLWHSVAIITGWIEELDTWNDIQAQIDSGYVEPLAHSRTHPHVPYIDSESEVLLN